MRKKKPKIYRDFNDYFSHGNHGMSSCSRDWIKEIWDDLEPTIKASQDDYKKAYVLLMQEQTERKSDVLDAALIYISKFTKKSSPSFWRWYLDYKRK